MKVRVRLSLEADGLEAGIEAGKIEPQTLTEIFSAKCSPTDSQEFVSGQRRLLEHFREDTLEYACILERVGAFPVEGLNRLRPAREVQNSPYPRGLTFEPGAESGARCKGGRVRELQEIGKAHTPHGWDAGVMYEESTGTLLCGDLFTQLGDGPALTESDIVGPAIAAENLFQYSCLNPNMGTTIRALAKLSPRALALMHGPSFSGDGRAALKARGSSRR